MINSKLLEIIKTLTNAEMQRLSRFLRSPYFQKKEISRDEMTLFNLLEADHPVFKTENWAKEKVYQKLYPKEDLVKGKLEKRMSALQKQVEHFLIEEINREETDSFKKKLNLAKFYKKKELSRLYQIVLTNLEKILGEITQKKKEDLYNEFLLQKEITEYKSLYNTRREDLNLPNTLKSLDVFYLSAKLEYSCGLLSQNNFHIPVDVKDSLTILESIIPIINSDSFLQIPLINIYAQIFLLLQDMDNIATYTQLEILLKEKQEFLPAEQLRLLRTFCRSFCVRQMNRGNKIFAKKSYLLYKEHLELGYLFLEGGLVPATFRNIVSVGLSQKQYEWVKCFLEDYKDKIVGTEFPQDVYHLNLANYFLAIKQYDNALEYLVDQYDDMYYHIAAKRMEIKAYYELNSVLLDSKMDAFKVFIHRFSKKKLPETPREGNKNFINALKQMIAPGTQFDPKRIARIKEKIENQEVIAERDWVLEKINQFKSS